MKSIGQGGVVGASSFGEFKSISPGSWIEIHSDNTILIRTGKGDFGQDSTFTAYRQIVAEELSASFESITTAIGGDTHRTPDGSGAFDFLDQRRTYDRRIGKSPEYRDVSGQLAGNVSQDANECPRQSLQQSWRDGSQMTW